jgi:calcineurin-like phosphoesterase family protein
MIFGQNFKIDNLYFVGCCHLQHKNITRGESSWATGGTRDFDTTQEMTTAVVRSLQTVPVDAHLFILGDFLFGKKENMRAFLNLIGCQNLYYIYGNHCTWMRKHDFSDRFHFVGDYLEIYWHNKMICMSHYPFAVWNESHRGSWMIHSHSHGSYHPGLPGTKDRGKILDVGWDVFQKPVDILRVKDIMDKKETVFEDHHNKGTSK